MTTEQKNLIITIAWKTNEKMKNDNLTEAETMTSFVNSLKEQGVFLTNWFLVDSEIREANETENWFWLIRRLRNTLQMYV